MTKIFSQVEAKKMTTTFSTKSNVHWLDMHAPYYFFHYQNIVITT